GGVQPGAVRGRVGRGVPGCGRGGPRARRVGGGGRDPGVWVVALRGRPGGCGGRRRVQVVDGTARVGLRLPEPGDTGADGPARGELVRRRGPVLLLLRTADAAGAGRPPVRSLPSLVLLCGDRARTGAGGADRGGGHS